ncbi:hypothetical protein K438DRAFT_2131054 [Mycena galopus ATCC 62051]|nr:hypothetical protein K438DRAFT_2131054 [Mycena galopus ATCC 62051]
MDNNNNNNDIPRTRAATHAGIHPAPPPIYGPRVVANPSTAMASPVAASADSSVAARAAARNVPASAGDDSSELPLLTMSEENDGAMAPLLDLDRDWTPVSRKTSRTHRERQTSLNRSKDTHSSASNSSSSDNESESTVARAMTEMSSEQLNALVRRHEAMTAQYCAALQARTPVPKATSKSPFTRSEGNAPNFGSLTPEISARPAARWWRR